MSRIVRHSQHRVMPWKNGAGSTAEIIVSPAGATFDSFDWRVSLARLDRDAEFSRFAGVDRTLSLLGRAPLQLILEGGVQRTLDSAERTFSFPGEHRVRATLSAGPSLDLNVMTRRERFRHRFERYDFAQMRPIECRCEVTLIFAAAGSLLLANGETSVELHEFDTLWLGTEDGPAWRLEGQAACVVEIERVS